MKTNFKKVAIGLPTILLLSVIILSSILTMPTALKVNSINNKIATLEHDRVMVPNPTSYDEQIRSLKEERVSYIKDSRFNSTVDVKKETLIELGVILFLLMGIYEMSHIRHFRNMPTELKETLHAFRREDGKFSIYSLKRMKKIYKLYEYPEFTFEYILKYFVESLHSITILVKFSLLIICGILLFIFSNIYKLLKKIFAWNYNSLQN